MTVIKHKKYIIVFSIIVFIMLMCSYILYASIDKEEISNEELQVSVENVVEETNTIQENIVLENNVINIVAESEEEIIVEPKTYQGYEMIATLKVPSIDIEYPVLAENSDELMKITLNKYWGCNPNEVGNLCIVGHNYKSGKHFGKLKYVKIGDKLLVTDNSDRTLTYEVYDTYVIDPYDTKCTSQLTDGRKDVTLITCTNAGKNRLVVKAREII